MKIYLQNNVFDEALNRTRRIFNEFENVQVGMSGGKDSTVVFNLAMTVAREMGRLPLRVMWIDQEAEWQGTVDFVTSIMEREDVDPLWFQMPMVITNNASSTQRYSYCWKEGMDWIHPKHELSIKENVYGTDRFHDLFPAILDKTYGNEPAANLAGVRAEESPRRAMGMTQHATYKDITWGRVENKKLQHFAFYPIYDWSYTDVWKAIHDNGWEYNRIYDEMYRYGLGVREMRVSNLHHETAIQSLLLVQEIEPETWNKVVSRIDGANTVGMLRRDSFTCPTVLPEMFTEWEDYAMHLAKHLIPEQGFYNSFMDKASHYKKIYGSGKIRDDYWRIMINTILSSDFDYTKLGNWLRSKDVSAYYEFKKGIYKPYQLRFTKFFEPEEKLKLITELSK